MDDDDRRFRTAVMSAYDALVCVSGLDVHDFQGIQWAFPDDARRSAVLRLASMVQEARDECLDAIKDLDDCAQFILVKERDASP